MGQSRPGLGGGQTWRETEQEKNIKEEGQEREKEREERLLERGARRSPACCQVPGFPSPLHKRTPAGLNWEGGVKRGEGPIHKKKKSSALPPSLEAFTPPPPPHGSSLSPPLSPLQPSDTPAQANYQALCSRTAPLILMRHARTSTQTQRVHNGAYHKAS